MSLPETAFNFIDLPARSTKPRSEGLTMMIDWGLPLEHQKDITSGTHDYIDMAKIAATISGVMPIELLRSKLAAYKSVEISTSQGGLFFEMAYLQSKTDQFFEEVVDLGFTAIEISDNLLSWSLEEKQRVIERAANDFGLNVLGEVGRKDAAMKDNEILADLMTCFDAGSSAVFVEVYELFAGDNIRDELITGIAENFPDQTIIYELPVVVLPGITREFKHKATVWMADRFGPNVNLANVEWDEIWMTEIIRRRGADNLDMDASDA